MNAMFVNTKPNPTFQTAESVSQGVLFQLCMNFHKNSFILF